MIEVPPYIISPLARIPRISELVKLRGPFREAMFIPYDRNNFPIISSIRPLSRPDMYHPDYLLHENFPDPKPLLAIPVCGKAIRRAIAPNEETYPIAQRWGIDYFAQVHGGTFHFTEGPLIGTITIHSYLAHIGEKQVFWICGVEGITRNGTVKIKAQNTDGQHCDLYIPNRWFRFPWYWCCMRFAFWCTNQGYLDDEVQDPQPVNNPSTDNVLAIGNPGQAV